MPPETQSPQPRVRVERSAPTSPVVMRGSAPRGTFAIPDDGLRLGGGKSFLARFQAGLRIRLAAAEPNTCVEHPINTGGGEPAQKADLIDVGRETSNGVGPEEHVDEDTNLEPHARRNAGLDAGPDAGPDADPDAEEEPKVKSKAKADAKADESPEPDKGGALAPEKEAGDEVGVEVEVEADLGKKRGDLDLDGVQSIAFETLADEAEDTLINVVHDEESLLSDRRPSYPVLRFSAAQALLDQHALDTTGLPLGFMWSPFGEVEGVPRTSRAASRCGTCGSFLARGNGGEDVLGGARVWTCGFCGRNDNDAGDEAEHPQLAGDTVEIVHGEGRSGGGRGVVVLVVDENLEEEEATWARAAVASVHASAAEKGLRFALICVGAACSVATRYKEGGASPVLEFMSVPRARSLSADQKEQYFLNPPASFPASAGQDDGLSQSSYTDVFINARTSPEADEGLEGEGTEGARKNRLPPEAESRRLDAAISVAFELISDTGDSDTSRILCLLTGPPTLEQVTPGPGPALENGQTGKPAAEETSDANLALNRTFEQIGAKAGELRIALDFLCFGAPHGFAGTVLLAAAKRSRGGLVYSAAHSFSAASALAEAATFLSDRSTSPGVVSLRVSSPLVVARVIGPAFPTAAPHTYAVPGIDPTTGFTVILTAKPGIEESTPIPSHAVVQLAAKSLDTTRVVTAQLPLTRNSSEYLRNIDAEICALILGKACIVSGGALTQPAIAARSIDVSARRLLRSSEATAGVVRLLFELRKGLLVESQVNPDCSLVLRSFFLRAETSIASLVMSPRLFTDATSDAGTGLMAEVPLEKSQIKKDSILVLDTGFNVFVYVGDSALPQAEEAISESARSVAAQRVSPCQLWKLRAGHDADFLLDSYLSPSDDAETSASPSPTSKGFLPYCKSLAPDSVTVRLLQSA